MPACTSRRKDREAALAIFGCACILFVLVDQEPALVAELERQHRHVDELQSRPEISAGFSADVELRNPLDGCQRVPAAQTLPQATTHDIDFSHCAFMPLARPEPYREWTLL